MRSKLTTARVLVVVAGIVFAMSWALPAIGANGPPPGKPAAGPRAYARMDNPCAVASPCTIDHDKGISGIRQSSTAGLYCVTASDPTIDQATTSWFVNVDVGDTDASGYSAQAQPDSNNAGCNSNEFEVITYRVGIGNATDIAFFVLIP